MCACSQTAGQVVQVEKTSEEAWAGVAAIDRGGEEGAWGCAPPPPLPNR
jgi:hypothetical protein